ncbi:hypothetical protein BDW42DRAFT_171647 [Aspergillus taichungensis]|uniref:Uncharacterized protein n=1 Tax=Aspergillus taichungensis TaxID=482145 RepID=A0A2J5HRT4_9EURO|nr:hypothetical protein BDW42DRAFT_171647 [Aspergillus taichungensis]
MMGERTIFPALQPYVLFAELLAGARCSRTQYGRLRSTPSPVGTSYLGHFIGDGLDWRGLFCPSGYPPTTTFPETVDQVSITPLGSERVSDGWLYRHPKFPSWGHVRHPFWKFQWIAEVYAAGAFMAWWLDAVDVICLHLFSMMVHSPGV